jgi:hypothetical protein
LSSDIAPENNFAKNKVSRGNNLGYHLFSQPYALFKKDKKP